MKSFFHFRDDGVIKFKHSSKAPIKCELYKNTPSGILALASITIGWIIEKLMGGKKSISKAARLLDRRE